MANEDLELLLSTLHRGDEKGWDEYSPCHHLVTFFMQFHREDVGSDIAADLFPETDPAKLSFAEMMDCFDFNMEIFCITHES